MALVHEKTPQRETLSDSKGRAKEFCNVGFIVSAAFEIQGERDKQTAG